MAIKHFRRGESTYVCRVCKKTTRNTGGDEANVQLCLQCFDLSGIDNHLSDNDAQSMRETYGSEATAIFAKRPELKVLFEDVWHALQGD